jgi:hypothetical protein
MNDQSGVPAVVLFRIGLHDPNKILINDLFEYGFKVLETILDIDQLSIAGAVRTKLVILCSFN